MSLFGEDNDWFDVSNELWLDPKTLPKRLKLCTDANVPLTVIEEIRREGIPVRTAYDDNIATHSDKAILAWSKRLKRVLFTLDRHFWNDRLFPLQNVPGIIFIDVPPDDTDNILKSFGLIYGTFASSYDLNYWEGIKARETPKGYILRIWNQQGYAIEYAFKLKSGILLAKELTPSESP